MTAEVQSIIFDIDKFGLNDAIKWLLKHKRKITKVDQTHKTYRFRQKNPKNYKRFRIKKIADGIKFIYGFK